jgi:hypothetical protein
MHGNGAERIGLLIMTICLLPVGSKKPELFEPLKAHQSPKVCSVMPSEMFRPARSCSEAVDFVN